MINIETDKQIKNNSDDIEILSKKYFSRFTKDEKEYLSSEQFYVFLEVFLKEYDKTELYDSLKDENLFLTYLNDHTSNSMNFEEFSASFKDLYALIRQTEDGNIDVDFKFEDADINII